MMLACRAIRRRAFSLVEVLVVVVILGILAAVAVPQVNLLREEARDQAGVNTLHGVRASIASFRGRAVVEGNDPFPTLAELTTLGTVLDRDIGPNPWTGVSGVRAATSYEASLRNVVSPETYGWAYYESNAPAAPVAVFYANCSDTTTRTDPATGTAMTANDL